MSRILPASVRGQAVLGAVVVVTLFGLLTGVASYLLVTQAAKASETEIVSARIDDLVEQLGDAGGAGSDELDVGTVAEPNPVFVQVVTSTGDVLATSPGLSEGARLCPSGAATGAQTDMVDLNVGTGSGPYVREVRPVAVGSRAFVVCAAVSGQPVQRVQGAVLAVLLVLLPLSVAAVGLAVWLAVGRALGAVDDLRVQAEALEESADEPLRVRATGDEVERLGRTLNGLLDRLRSQTRSVRQFVADAGHELRNPLTTLRISLEFGKDASEEDVRASMTDALSDVDRLEELVQDLLALARSDARERTTEFGAVDLAALVLGASDVVRRTRPDVDLTLDVSPCVVEGDEGALRSMVVNLVDNAARHAVGRVSLTLTTDDGDVTLRVDDDGHGLDADDCERVFDRFVRLDDARIRDEGGSGLGLAIVASVAQGHGGSAAAQPGPGGHFIVTLPVPPAGRRGTPLGR